MSYAELFIDIPALSGGSPYRVYNRGFKCQIISFKHTIPMKSNPLLVVWVPVCTCEGCVMCECVWDVCYVCVCVCRAICSLLSQHILSVPRISYLLVRFVVSRGAEQALKA